MARVPASFIKNYIAAGGAHPSLNPGTAPPPSPATQAPASPPTQAAPSPATQAPPPPKSKPKPAAPGRSRAPAKKSHGFFRKALGAVAGEVLKGTGHIGKQIVRSIHEDAMGSGGMPTNNASSGAVAGLGVGAQEPGVKKNRKAPRLSYKLFKRARKDAE